MYLGDYFHQYIDSFLILLQLAVPSIVFISPFEEETKTAKRLSKTDPRSRSHMWEIVKL